MKGVAVLCLFFMVIPGPEVSATTQAIPTIMTKTETTNTTTSNTATPTTETSNTATPTTETSNTATPTTETSNTATPTTETSNTATPTTETSNTTTPEAETSNTTTPEAETSNTTTPTTETSNTTQTSVPDDSTASSPTSSKPTSCAQDVCSNSSICLQLNETYVCQCPLNYFYNTVNQTCSEGKSFFGEFILQEDNYNPNPESKEYTDLYNKVMNMSVSSLSHLEGYKSTVIVQISVAPSTSQTRSRRSTTNVSVRVSQIFTKETNVTSDEITAAINNSAGLGTYASKTICDGFYCDPETTECVPTPDGLRASCTCKEGKYSNLAVPEVTSCRDCNPQCYQTEEKYCKTDSKNGAECVCRPGYKSKEDTCNKCNFGYSGVNCEDNYLLIVVIVGAVLGAAVVALLGAVIGISVRSTKEKKYGERLIQDETTKSSPAPVRLFPKVQPKTDQGEVNRAADVYEDNEEYSRNFPKRDYDENPWYEMAKRDQKY